MSAGLLAVLETVGEVLLAYKKRIAELEAIVATQQAQIEAKE